MHPGQQLSGNRKPKSASFDFVCPQCIQPLEGIEQLAQIFLADTAAGVFDRNLQGESVCAGRGVADRHFNLSVPGKFHSVVCQVQDNLVDADMIAQHYFWQIRRKVNNKFNIFCTDPGRDGIDNIINQRCWRIFGYMNTDRAGFDFGKVQDIVDNG